MPDKNYEYARKDLARQLHRIEAASFVDANKKKYSPVTSTVRIDFVSAPRQMIPR